MKKAADSVRQIIENNPTLQFGFANGLLNLAQTAKFLKPIIESETQKEISVGAIQMQLSRLNRQRDETNDNSREILLTRLTLQTNLVVFTYRKTNQVLENLDQFQKSARKKHAFFSVSESTNEITIVVDASLAVELERTIAKKTVAKKRVSRIVAKFNEKNFRQTSLIHAIIQQIEIKKINIVEIICARSKIIFYVEKEDANFIFEVLERKFLA